AFPIAPAIRAVAGRREVARDDALGRERARPGWRHSHGWLRRQGGPMAPNARPPEPERAGRVAARREAERRWLSEPCERRADARPIPLHGRRVFREFVVRGSERA